MSSIDDGELYLEIPDATEEQLRRGIIAARQSLEQSGGSIADAFTGYFNRGAADDLGSLSVLADADYTNAQALDEAWIVGITAACGQNLASVGGSFGLLEIVRESERFEREVSAMLPAVNRVERRDTGPHFSLSSVAIAPESIGP